MTKIGGSFHAIGEFPKIRATELTPIVQKKHPVIILGGGPAGAVTAMYLLRRGIPVVIIERDVFPRFHVGETMTGATALALRDLGLGEALDAKRYPVKHGVRFYGTNGQNAFWVPIMRRIDEHTQVPNQTWSVMRSTFGSRMYGLVATITSIALERNVTAATVRQWCREGPLSVA